MGGCHFPRCGNNSSKPKYDATGQKITHHLITSNEKHRAKIINKINELREKRVRKGADFIINEKGKKIQVPSINAKLCSSHYASDMFIYETTVYGETRKKLRDDAVPIYRNQKEKDQAEMLLYNPSTQQAELPITPPATNKSVTPPSEKIAVILQSDGTISIRTRNKMDTIIEKPTVGDIGTPPNQGANPFVFPSIIIREGEEDYSICDGKQIPQQSTRKRKTKTHTSQKQIVQDYEMPSTSGSSAAKCMNIVVLPIPQHQSTSAECQNPKEINATTETQNKKRDLLERAMKGLGISDNNYNFFKSSTHTHFFETSVQQKDNDPRLNEVAQNFPLDHGVTFNHNPVDLLTFIDKFFDGYLNDDNNQMTLTYENDATTSNKPDTDPLITLVTQSVCDGKQMAATLQPSTEDQTGNITELVPILDTSQEGSENYNDVFKSATHARLPENSEPTNQGNQLNIVVPKSDGNYCVRIGNKIIRMEVSTENTATTSFDGLQEGTVATDTFKDLPSDSANFLKSNVKQISAQTQTEEWEYILSTTSKGLDIPNEPNSSRRPECMKSTQTEFPVQNTTNELPNLEQKTLDGNLPRAEYEDDDILQNLPSPYFDVGDPKAVIAFLESLGCPIPK